MLHEIPCSKNQNHRQVKVFSYTLTLKSAIACREMLGRIQTETAQGI